MEGISLFQIWADFRGPVFAGYTNHDTCVQEMNYITTVPV